MSTKLRSLAENKDHFRSNTKQHCYVDKDRDKNDIANSNKRAQRQQNVSYFHYKQSAWKSDMCRDGQTVAFYTPTATNNTILKFVQCKIALQLTMLS